MAKHKPDSKPGRGKLLDAWCSPADAGDPVGCAATTFTFSAAFFEEECLARFLHLESDPAEDGPAYLVEREEKLSKLIEDPELRRTVGAKARESAEKEFSLTAALPRYISLFERLSKK